MPAVIVWSARRLEIDPHADAFTPAAHLATAIAPHAAADPARCPAPPTTATPTRAVPVTVPYLLNSGFIVEFNDFAWNVVQLVKNARS